MRSGAYLDTPMVSNTSANSAVNDGGRLVPMVQLMSVSKMPASATTSRASLRRRRRMATATMARAPRHGTRNAIDNVNRPVSTTGSVAQITTSTTANKPATPISVRSDALVSVGAACCIRCITDAGYD